MKTKVLFTSRQIKTKTKQLARQIAKDFKGEKIILVCVLNGAFMFFSDLSKELWDQGHENFEVDFVRVSSYGKGKKSSGKPILTKDFEVGVKGRNVVIVEDIIETGTTLKFLVDTIRLKKPSVVKICTLLDKPLRKVKIEPDYTAFKVKPQDWVEGYGLDTAFLGRGRKEIVKRI